MENQPEQLADWVPKAAYATLQASVHEAACTITLDLCIPHEHVGVTGFVLHALRETLNRQPIPRDTKDRVAIATILACFVTTPLPHGTPELNLECYVKAVQCLNVFVKKDPSMTSIVTTSVQANVKLLLETAQDVTAMPSTTADACYTISGHVVTLLYIVQRLKQFDVPAIIAQAMDSVYKFAASSLAGLAAVMSGSAWGNTDMKTRQGYVAELHALATLLRTCIGRRKGKDHCHLLPVLEQVLHVTFKSTRCYKELGLLHVQICVPNPKGIVASDPPPAQLLAFLQRARGHTSINGMLSVLVATAGLPAGLLCPVTTAPSPLWVSVVDAFQAILNSGCAQAIVKLKEVLSKLIRAYLEQVDTLRKHQQKDVDLGSQGCQLRDLARVLLAHPAYLSAPPLNLTCLLEQSISSWQDKMDFLRSLGTKFTKSETNWALVSGVLEFVVALDMSSEDIISVIPSLGSDLLHAAWASNKATRNAAISLWRQLEREDSPVSVDQLCTYVVDFFCRGLHTKTPVLAALPQHLPVVESILKSLQDQLVSSDAVIDSAHVSEEKEDIMFNIPDHIYTTASSLLHTLLGACTHFKDTAVLRSLYQASAQAVVITSTMKDSVVIDLVWQLACVSTWDKVSVDTPTSGGSPGAGNGPRLSKAQLSYGVNALHTMVTLAQDDCLDTGGGRIMAYFRKWLWCCGSQASEGALQTAHDQMTSQGQSDSILPAPELDNLSSNFAPAQSADYAHVFVHIVTWASRCVNDKNDEGRLTIQLMIYDLVTQGIKGATLSSPAIQLAQTIMFDPSVAVSFWDLLHSGVMGSSTRIACTLKTFPTDIVTGICSLTQMSPIALSLMTSEKGQNHESTGPAGSAILQLAHDLSPSSASPGVLMSTIALISDKLYSWHEQVNNAVELSGNPSIPFDPSTFQETRLEYLLKATQSHFKAYLKNCDPATLSSTTCPQVVDDLVKVAQHLVVFTCSAISSVLSSKEGQEEVPLYDIVERFDDVPLLTPRYPAATYETVTSICWPVAREALTLLGLALCACTDAPQWFRLGDLDRHGRLLIAVTMSTTHTGVLACAADTVRLVAQAVIQVKDTSVAIHSLPLQWVDFTMTILETSVLSTRERSDVFRSVLVRLLGLGLRDVLNSAGVVKYYRSVKRLLALASGEAMVAEKDTWNHEVVPFVRAHAMNCVGSLTREREFLSTATLLGLSEKALACAVLYSGSSNYSLARASFLAYQRLWHAVGLVATNDDVAANFRAPQPDTFMWTFPHLSAVSERILLAPLPSAEAQRESCRPTQIFSVLLVLGALHPSGDRMDTSVTIMSPKLGEVLERLAFHPYYHIRSAAARALGNMPIALSYVRKATEYLVLLSSTKQANRGHGLCLLAGALIKAQNAFYSSNDFVCKTQEVVALTKACSDHVIPMFSPESKVPGMIRAAAFRVVRLVILLFHAFADSASEEERSLLSSTGFDERVQTLVHLDLASQRAGSEHDLDIVAEPHVCKQHAKLVKSLGHQIPS